MLPYVTKDNAKEIVKKAIESAGVGTTVVANPEGTATADLNKIGINNVIYNISAGGSQVVANPGGVLTDTLSSIAIDGVSYGIESGASGEGAVIINATFSVVNANDFNITISEADVKNIINLMKNGKPNIIIALKYLNNLEANLTTYLYPVEKFIDDVHQIIFQSLHAYFDTDDQQLELSILFTTDDITAEDFEYELDLKLNDLKPVRGISGRTGISVNTGSYGYYTVRIDTSDAQVNQVLGYDNNGGVYWKTVSGGGSYTAGYGININNNTIEAKIDNDTLYFGSWGQLQANLSEGLTSSGSGIRVNCSSNGGITIDSQGLKINTGSASQNQVLTYNGSTPGWNSIENLFAEGSQGQVLTYNASAKTANWQHVTTSLKSYSYPLTSLLHSSSNLEKLKSIAGNYYISGWNDEPDNILVTVKAINHDGMYVNTGSGQSSWLNVGSTVSYSGSLIYYNDFDLFN